MTVEYTQIVIKVIANYLERDAASIQDGTNLEEELGFDSTELIGIIVDVEKIIGVSLKGVNYSKLKTPADLGLAIHDVMSPGQAA